MPHYELIVAIIGAVLGSNGLWSLIQWMLNKNSVEREALLGILYDRIVHSCRKYIERGFISVGEYEDLSKYLYTPYRKLGGNGTAEALMKIVEQLPKHRKDVEKEAD